MEDDEYEFWVDAYTPDTIPMERLAKYMAAIAKLLGHGSSVHFSRLDTGSTVNVLRVEKEAAPKVLDRLEQVASGAAANDATAAFDELNTLLRDDNAIGKLSRKTAPAARASVILRFLGRDLPRQPIFGPFHDTAVIEAELVRIGGRDKTAHAQLVDAEGKTWSGEMERDLARKMAPHLYNGTILRVTGDARWERRADASWHMQAFKIMSFEILADDTLTEATQRLRRLQKTTWDEIDDVDSYITATRGDIGGVRYRVV